MRRMALSKTAQIIKDLADYVNDSDRVVLTTADLDGDSIGAIVALHNLLIQLFPDVGIEIVCEREVPERYRFLVPGTCPFSSVSSMPSNAWSDNFVIILDSDPGRFDKLAAAFQASKYKGTVDHHQNVTTSNYDFVHYDPVAPSTTMLVYELFTAAGVRPSLKAAYALYAGLVFDTSIFRYKLTTADSLRMAADLTEQGVDHTLVVDRLLLVQPLERVRLRARVLGSMALFFDGKLALSSLTRSESDGVDSGGLVDDLVFIEGVEVAALSVPVTDNRVRLSLRSRSDVNVAAIARALHPSGGGHRRASGVTLQGTVETIEARLKSLLTPDLERG